MKEIIPFKTVLIADRITSFDNITIANNNLELIEDDYYVDVDTALKSLTKGVIHYQTPEEFMNNIAKHKNDIVFPLWSGLHSRNRRALIPSICEAYKIKYVGADTYANIISQDKTMSKAFCRKQGIASADYVLYNDYFQSHQIKHLKLPLVVKPNFEGGSIGISKRNLVDSPDDALVLAQEIYSIHKQDVLIEEFIPGREVSIVISGSKKEIKLAEAIEIVFDDGLGGFENKLYSFEIKKANEDGLHNRRITDHFPVETINDAIKIFRLLGKVENLRIDGKYDQTGFKLIELSPDIHYGEGSTFSFAFQSAGYAYEDMMRVILENTIDSFS